MNASPSLPPAAATVDRVLFVDDDPAMREANLQTLELAGFRVEVAASGADALARIPADFPGIVVTDVRMPIMDGLQLFRRLREQDTDLPVILITGHGDIDMAVSAMHEGAYDFLAKPYPAERLATAARNALDKRRLVLENRRLQRLAQEARESLPLIGETPVMQRLRKTLQHLATADVDVLVLGETGAGKEVVAQALHDWGGRRAQAFVGLNCGALPDTVIESELFGHEAGAFTGAQRRRIGRIEHSSGGTLFLDEIESMPLSAQVKLLRVLETREISPLGTNEVRPVDLRVVAATKIDLSDPAQRGDFRPDLFHRLNVVTVRVPPLRERRDDIPLLFSYFLSRAAARFKVETPPVPPAVRQHLRTHAWPGNVRELMHYAERVVLGVEEAAQEAPPGEASLPQRVERYEADLIREALARHHGDVKATLQALGIPRKTFYDKLQRHGIDRSEFVPGEARASVGTR
ncbi:MAG: sigma-54 dependent transcriptional regulator [Pigmentiphaga sp.]|uniref:sigma-54-dependent transcriptional regulator n=1 Tax=Pigmentiphaga sp. TaxID=1977564 RepID=UPI0029B8508B|nr:sigma-54 dependent transcriptional regulator [Pigmentiphaga sp.]MDX3904717.1 sigma-54 dependent transcriptional regulator [Pigmentiphaga sp.]